MKIISTNIGDRKEINWKGKMITTGIFKFPVNTPILILERTVCFIRLAIRYVWRKLNHRYFRGNSNSCR